MIDRIHFIRNLWRWSAGLPEQGPESWDPDEMEYTEWSPAFERLMRNRLIQGAYRYGKMAAQFKPQWRRVDSCKRRLDEYQETGNLELLVDVACLCVLEFVEGKHPKRHFEVIGDGQEHVESVHDNRRDARPVGEAATVGVYA